jgi:hypothetical protein
MVGALWNTVRTALLKCIRMASLLMVNGVLLNTITLPIRAGRFQTSMLDHEWIAKAKCRSMDREMFFDKYEEDSDLAKVVDSICVSCPVVKDCFDHGTTNNEWGVWGGVYLVDGEINATRNIHKTQEAWSKILDVVGTDG